MQPVDLGKWCRRAKYQEKIPDSPFDNDGKNPVRCSLCPHNCIVRDGKAGICRTRVNHDGVLYTLAYGNPCSISVDPIEKKPLFHFFPGTKIFSLSTAGCNFRCLNCQNWSISQTSPLEAEHYDMTPEELTEEALRQDLRGASQKNIRSIAFTYTEPTVFFEYIYDTVRIASEKGVKSVLISNGYINEKPLLELCPYLAAANIDLKCFDDGIYHKLTGGRLQPVLNTLKTLKKNGVWLEITNLIIPGWTDDRQMIQNMCEWLAGNGFADTPLHFSRFFPMYKLPQLLPTPVENLIMAKETAEKAGIRYVYIGNITGLQNENTRCPDCGQTVVARDGYKIKSINIKKDTGLCGFCGAAIAGVWE